MLAGAPNAPGAPAPAAAGAAGRARALDDFAAAEPSAGWEAAPAEGVRLALAPISPGGAGLPAAAGAAARRASGARLELDFQGHAGWAIARRRLDLDLPANYEVSFWVRGAAPPNNLEFKLLDATGDNVWWVVRRDFAWPGDWQRIAVKKRQLGFAWGPAGGGEIGHVSALEIAVSAGQGGRGWVELAGFVLEPLPPPHPYARRPVASASSAARGAAPALALDGDRRTRWHSLPAAAGEQWLQVDFLERRELGGLVVDWDGGDAATRFAVLTSADGAAWQTARTVERGEAGGREDGAGDGRGAGGGSGAAARGGAGDRSWLYLPDTDARYLRLRLLASRRGRGFGIREIGVLPVEVSASPNAFFQAIAKGAPRGSYPRAVGGEQTLWTLVGVDGGRDQGLLDQDGRLEAGSGGFSIEPFVFAGGRLTGWSEVSATPSLADGDLPIPSVRWSEPRPARPGDRGRRDRLRRRPDLALEITAFAAGPARRPVLHARYRLRNRGALPARPRLFLVLRPFQVNPPWQFLGRPGGAVELRRIAFDGRRVEMTVGAERVPRTLVPLSPAPSAFGAMTFDDGSIAELLRRGRVPAAAAVDDPFGYASGALAYDLRLAPGASAEVDVALPLGAAPSPGATLPAAAPAAPERAVDAMPSPGAAVSSDATAAPGASAGPEAGEIAAGPDAPARVDRLLGEVAGAWRARLGGVEVRLPAAAMPLAAELRTALAHILISRDGPALRPGTRAYARSWIRDGALMSDALLRLGAAPVVRGFAAWFAPFQAADGRVPCCADGRGADPVPENDSHGELLYLLASYYRFTGDRAFLDGMWSHVEGAVAYIDFLRRQRRTEAYRQSDKRAFYGLLPESISHEGYSAHPVHSYWDDFFALRGLADAADLAAALGKPDVAGRWAALRDELRTDLHASIRLTIASHHLDTLPASVELADFDPTSTAIAVAPGGELANLPQAELRRTFERYFEQVEERHRSAGWTSYTPYELRSVGTFVRLGWRDRAQLLLAGFMADRRPPGWNQWPEVVWRDPRYPGFLGDLPHAWVAAEYIRSFLDLLAYERDADHALVLAAGVPAAWVKQGPGVAVRGLRTAFGTLDYTLDASPTEARLRIAGDLRLPPGGLAVQWPFAGRPGSDQACRWLSQQGWLPQISTRRGSDREGNGGLRAHA